MIFRRRRAETNVYLPWERKRGIAGRFARTRSRQVIGVVIMIGAALLLRRREEQHASVRATRASLTTAYREVGAFRADHAGECPKLWSDLVAQGYARRAPIDAWGRPLRMVCPGRRDPKGFD
jgi:general secretion pathway protein G